MRRSGRLASGSTVHIHYRRLPAREQVFDQIVVEDGAEYVVTLLPSATVSKPVTVDGAVVLDPGAPVVWFTYHGLWHDLGRFHRADGTFTGCYANVLTPVEMRGARWETTDLCLDVWRGADGRVEVLDEEELREAERRGWVDVPTAARAREEAARLAATARAGSWPPAHVWEWTLQRAREAVSGAPDHGSAGDG